MLAFNTITFALLPIALVLVILLKKDRFKAKNSFWRNQKWKGIDIFIMIMSFSLFQLCALILGERKIVSYYYIFVYGNFISIVALGGLLFGILLFKYKANCTSLGLSRVEISSKIAVGLASFFLYIIIIAAFFFILNSEEFLYNRAQLFIKMKLNEWLLIHSAVYIIGLVIIAPFVEECVFRGFMYGPFQRKIGETGSICFTSIIWSLTHLQSKAFLGLFIIGIFLCYLYKRTKSLVPGIIVHSLMNISNLLVYAYLLSSGKGVAM